MYYWNSHYWIDRISATSWTSLEAFSFAGLSLSMWTTLWRRRFLICKDLSEILHNIITWGSRFLICTDLAEILHNLLTSESRWKICDDDDPGFPRLERWHGQAVARKRESSDSGEDLRWCSYIYSYMFFLYLSYSYMVNAGMLNETYSTDCLYLPANKRIFRFSFVLSFSCFPLFFSFPIAFFSFKVNV